MALTLKSWRKVVKSKWFQSDSFKNLNSAVVQYINANPKGMRVRQPLVTAWDEWLEKLQRKGKTLQQSDRYRRGCALDDIEQIVAQYRAEFPRSQQQAIAARDAANPTERRAGNHYVKGRGGWQRGIFSQQQQNSCTCACATTFLSKLIDRPIKESDFRNTYNRVNGVNNDFRVRGSYLPRIANTMRAYDAEVQLHNPANLDQLKALLDGATRELPMMIAIRWGTPTHPTGGAHAVMCLGDGFEPPWTAAHGGYLMEDPWPSHATPRLLDDGAYHVLDRRNNSWSEGFVDPAYGCIVGQKKVREFARPAHYRNVGVKVF
ncbi:MAG: hypothetical protein AAGK01_12090 [Pseudomonadota bacterium]